MFSLRASLRFASILVCALVLAAIAVTSASLANGGPVSGHATAAHKKCHKHKKKCRKQPPVTQPVVPPVMQPVAPASLGVNLPSQDFGSEATSGTTGDITFTVTNSGTATSGSLSTTLTGPNLSQFVIGTDTCNGATLIGGATCHVHVSFSPTSTGLKSATLHVSGSPGGTASSDLSGTGT